MLEKGQHPFSLKNQMRFNLYALANIAPSVSSSFTKLLEEDEGNISLVLFKNPNMSIIEMHHHYHNLNGSTLEVKNKEEEDMLSSVV